MPAQSGNNFLRVMPNDVINGQSIPKPIMHPTQASTTGTQTYGGSSSQQKQSSFNLDALSTECDELFDPRILNEKFDKLSSLVERIRQYTKEAGFGLVVINGSIVPNSSMPG